MSEPFTVVDSRRVFDGKVASVRVDRVRMPQGTVAAREVVEHDRAVAVVAIDEDNRVVLVEQYRHPFRRRLWELPAGLMDVADEPPLVTAQRELVEETGIAAASWAVLVDIASSPGFTDEAVRIFLARKLSDAGRPPGSRRRGVGPADRPGAPGRCGGCGVRRHDRQLLGGRRPAGRAQGVAP